MTNYSPHSFPLPVYRSLPPRVPRLLRNAHVVCGEDGDEATNAVVPRIVEVKPKRGRPRKTVTMSEVAADNVSQSGKPKRGKPRKSDTAENPMAYNGEEDVQHLRVSPSDVLMFMQEKGGRRVAQR